MAIPLLAAYGAVTAGMAAAAAGSMIVGGMMVAGGMMTAIGAINGDKHDLDSAGFKASRNWWGRNTQARYFCGAISQRKLLGCGWF